MVNPWTFVHTKKGCESTTPAPPGFGSGWMLVWIPKLLAQIFSRAPSTSSEGFWMFFGPSQPTPNPTFPKEGTTGALSWP